MEFKFMVIILLVGYGSRAQRFEGSPCVLHDGSRGVCKNIANCESIKEGLSYGTLRYNEIVGCSFVGTVQIVCCADERPKPGRNHPHRPVPTPPNTDFVFVNRPRNVPFWPPHHVPNENSFGNLPLTLPSVLNAAKNQLTEFIFPSDNRRRTTQIPIRVTTPRRFGPHWPSNGHNNGPNKWNVNHGNTNQWNTNHESINHENQWTERPVQTTTQMSDWMQNVLNEHSNTPRPNQVQTTPQPTRTTTANSFWSEWSATNPTPIKNEDSSNHVTETHADMRQTTPSMPDWMKDVVDELSTTTKKSDMLPWMQDIINEYSTTANTSVTHHTPQTTTVKSEPELPSWLRDVLHEASTTTVRSVVPAPFVTSTTQTPTFNGGSLVIGDGSVNLNASTPNSNENDSSPISRPGGTKKPPSSIDSEPNSRYSAGRKAEAACESYTALPSALSWNILGGVPTSLGEFPWMAALGYGDSISDMTFDCGGTVISDRFILTAAHCIPARRPPKMVRLGKVTLMTNDDDAEPLDLTIQEIIRHPNYKSTNKKNDIALLKVSERIGFNENIKPACLRTDLSDVLPDTKLYLTGWGSTSAVRTARPSVLLKTNVTAMPLTHCNTTLVNYNREADQPSLRGGLSGSQCCAYDPDARNDACQGDSGGPLQYFPGTSPVASIFGVVSFGISCGTSLPSVYTRVAYYLDWIEPIVWPN